MGLEALLYCVGRCPCPPEGRGNRENGQHWILLGLGGRRKVDSRCLKAPSWRLGSSIGLRRQGFVRGRNGARADCCCQSPNTGSFAGVGGSEVTMRTTRLT